MSEVRWKYASDRTATLRMLLGLVHQLANVSWADSASKGRIVGELTEELEALNKIVWRLMDEQQARKYHAARFCYRHRDENTPGVRKDEKGKPLGPVPWPVWFQQVFGDELDYYMAQCRERDTLKQVYEYELGRSGWSVLEPDMQKRKTREAVAA